MTNMKKCSVSHVIRGLQIKTMTYHYMPIRILKMQNTDKASVNEDVEQREIIHR